MTRELEFTEDVADVLREVGNIGAGHAASALSMLLAQQVDMSVPSARMVPFEAVPDIVGGPDSLVAAIYLRVEGVLDGHLLLVLPGASASLLVSKLLSDAIDIRDFSDFELSTLAEVGNILGGSFMNAIGDLTRFRSQLSVPAVTIDMASAVLDVCMLTAPEGERRTLLIETNISQGVADIHAHIVLVPDPAAMTPLLQALGC